jgi:hypothetical protein
MGAIIRRPSGTLAKIGKNNGLATINETLAAFLEPLTAAARYRREWEYGGRSIGTVCFPDGQPGPRSIDEARKIHGRWLREYPQLEAAESALFGVMMPIGPQQIDPSGAARMVTTLFAAIGMRKNDAENAMLLASAVEMFSPIDGLIGGATGLWEPVASHPLVLALAVKQLIASAKFTSCAELREAMAQVRHTIGVKHWNLEYLTGVIERSDGILFEHDRPTWEAHYEKVSSAVARAMLPVSERPDYDDDGTLLPGSPRWAAINNLVETKEAAEQLALPAREAACRARPAKRTRKPRGDDGNA